MIDEKILFIFFQHMQHFFSGCVQDKKTIVVKNKILIEAIERRVKELGIPLSQVALLTGKERGGMYRTQTKVNWKLDFISSIGKAIGVDLFYELAEPETKGKMQEERERLASLAEEAERRAQAALQEKERLLREIEILKVRLEECKGRSV